MASHFAFLDRRDARLSQWQYMFIPNSEANISVNIRSSCQAKQPQHWVQDVWKLWIVGRQAHLSRMTNPATPGIFMNYTHDSRESIKLVCCLQGRNGTSVHY